MRRGFARTCFQVALVGAILALLLARPTGQIAAQREGAGGRTAVDAREGMEAGRDAAWLEKARLSLSVAEEPDRPFFGWSVAISADGDTAAVGARGAANGEGRIYIFEKPAGGWATTTGYTAVLSVSDSAYHLLEGAVAISADGSTVVGGAVWEEALFVFVRSPGGWTNATETAKLRASDDPPASGYLMGYSVDISDDGSTVVSGTHMAAGSSGAAYVWVRPAGGWTSSTETAKLTPNQIFGHFGKAVAISGDGNTVLVGAPFEACGVGAAYPFARPAAGWVSATASTKLLASDPLADVRYGISVALDAGGSTAVVGANGDGVEPLLGKAYVFVRPGAAWANATETARLTASDGAAGDMFGNSVALTADGGALLVGAPRRNQPTGAAYFFARPAGGWVPATETQKLTDGDADGEDAFGFVLAMDGLGRTSLIGAYLADSWHGAAYLFEPALPAVDLRIEKTAWPASRLALHDPITYTLVLDNAGSEAAEGVALTDTLPIELDFARWVPGGQPAGALVSQDQITWGGDLAAGGTITFTFVASHVAETAGAVTNVAAFSHTAGTGSDAVTVVVGYGHAVYLPLMMHAYLVPPGP